MVKRIGTKKIFTVLTILLVMILFASEQAFSWTISRGFEDGTVGQPATNSSYGFSWSNGITFSNTKAHNGTKSVACQFYQYSAGEPGATFENGTSVGANGEAWYRAYYYFPTGWNWGHGGAVQMGKIMRFTTTRSDSAHLSVYAYGDQIGISNEPASEYPGSHSSSGVKFDVGQWQSIEMYVKLNATHGIFRIWKNGVLIQEDTNLPTVSSSSDGLQPMHILFNYWNGGPLQTQTAYVDDILITSDAPSNVDEHGNRMIGPTDWQNGNTYIPLLAPTGLKLTATAN